MANPCPVFVLALLAVLYIWWYFSRSRQILKNWARDNHYAIVSSEYRLLFKGPFWAANNQAVYYVTVQTADGRTRSGWVRCGGFFLGMLADKADVRWDE